MFTGKRSFAANLAGIRSTPGPCDQSSGAVIIVFIPFLTAALSTAFAERQICLAVSRRSQHKPRTDYRFGHGRKYLTTLNPGRPDQSCAPKICLS